MMRSIGTAGIQCFSGPCNPWSKVCCQGCAIKPMKVYVGDGVMKYIPWMAENGFGALFVSQYRNVNNYPYYSLDNGAYSAFANSREWDPARFLRLLGRSMKEIIPPDFVVCPDKVAKGLESLEFSLSWLDKLPEGPRYFLAVQDGMERPDVEPSLKRFDGLFVGGSMDWKMETAEGWVNLAHAHNKPCHIGRIGPWYRILWANRINADSIDSTTWVREDRRYHIEYAKTQEVLAVDSPVLGQKE